MFPCVCRKQSWCWRSRFSPEEWWQDHSRSLRNGAFMWHETRVLQCTCDTDNVVQGRYDTVHVWVCQFCARPAVAWWCVVNVLISCRCKIYHLAPMFANYCPGPAVVRGQQRPSSSLHSLFGCPVSSSSRSPAPRDGDRRLALGAAQQLCNLSGRHHTHWRPFHNPLCCFTNLCCYNFIVLWVKCNYKCKWPGLVCMLCAVNNKFILNLKLSILAGFVRWGSPLISSDKL